MVEAFASGDPRSVSTLMARDIVRCVLHADGQVDFEVGPDSSLVSLTCLHNYRAMQSAFTRRM